MSNYNDGRWHGWNGGECPVHPKSIVNIIGPGSDGTDGLWLSLPAGHVDWSSSGAFRVTKEFREPRDFWIGSDGRAYLHKKHAPAHSGKPVIRVREVLE